MAIRGAEPWISCSSQGSPLRAHERMLEMFRKPGTLAIISLLLMPLVSMAGAMLAFSIDPEIAARSANYERNYMLLDAIRSACLLATLVATMALWLLSCHFLLKAKRRSYGWLLLAALGPFGLIALTMLGDNAPDCGDRHRKFVGELKTGLRVVYEACLFMAISVFAFLTMLLKSEVMILYQSARTGMSVAQIVDLKNASSGMWAFTEGLEVLYLVALCYLLWPACFNLVGNLARSWTSSGRSWRPRMNSRSSSASDN